MFSNRRPYYGLKLSIADFFREPVRYLKQSNTQESMMEKPYRVGEYPKMHLSLPDFKYKPKKRAGFLGPIASGVPYGGFASIDYGDARCRWGIPRYSWCIREPVVVTLTADVFWTSEFNFVTEVSESDIDGVTIQQLPGTEAFAWDEQDYLLTFPENANGSITICGFASTYTLTSQTFETVVAGMPVGIYKIGSSLMAIEQGQANPALLLKNSYGMKGAKCGCITITSSCDPCANVTPIAWDDGASADTVAQSSSVGVAVQDGLGPYNWSVSGTGFTLTHAQTAGVSNILNAGGSACGSATITVADQCGSTSGLVRCTTGAWSALPWSCVIPGGWTTKLNSWSYERIAGKYKIQMNIGAGGNPPGASCNQADCSIYGDIERCISWSCGDVGGWGDCGGYCCETGDGCDADGSSLCIKNIGKWLWEWDC